MRGITIPKALNKSYIPALDGLRGIAIITVIISHMLLNTSLAKYMLGNIGVEIFFVLSGFLITTLLLKEKMRTGSISLTNFYIRRALRILPVAYLFLMVLLVLSYIFTLNTSAGSFMASAFYIRNLHLNYAANSYNAHFWTLAVEEQFYFIFPLLLVYSLKNYLRIVYFLVLAVPVLQFLGYNNIGIFQSNVVIHKITFLIINLFGNGTTSILIGSGMAIFMFTTSFAREGFKTNKFLSIVVFCAAITFRLAFADTATSNYIISTIFSIAIAAVIAICLYNTGDMFNEILQSKALIKLGILSYSIYIWQQIFLHQPPWTGLFKYADSLFFNLPVLFIVAWVSYYFYEVRFLKLKEKYSWNHLNKEKSPGYFKSI